jgi:subtilisin family serine protease
MNLRTFGVRALLALPFLALGGCSDLVTDAALTDGSVAAINLNAGAAPGVGLSGAARAGDLIPDQYIVVFRPGAVAQVEHQAQGLVRGAGGTLLFTYEHALEGFAAILPAQAVEGIRRNPNVRLVEEDGVVEASTISTQTNATWGIDRVDQRALPLSSTYSYSLTGSGVQAYIVDTGIRPDHVEFSGRIGAGFTAISDGQGTTDCNGHGTHVAGTTGGNVYGVAKGVTLIPVRVLNCSGSGTMSGVIAGVDWITGQRMANPGLPMVANMSLGGGTSSALDSAVNNLSTAGVTVVVAAGNSNADACRYSPARAAGAVTVAATTSTDARASYSNFGSCVDLFAPGSSITAAWHTSGTALATLNGTSMASPHVAGAVALHLEAFPLSSPSDIRSAITGNATRGTVSSAGRQSPNLLLYTGYLLQTAPAPEPPADEPTPEDPPVTEPPVTEPPADDAGEVAIRSFDITQNSNRTFTRASAAWQVSGTELKSVQIELMNGATSVVQRVEVAVSGSSASGTTNVSVRGAADRVRITVTDKNGTRVGVKGLDNQWIGEDPTASSPTG